MSLHSLLHTDYKISYCTAIQDSAEMQELYCHVTLRFPAKFSGDIITPRGIVSRDIVSHVTVASHGHATSCDVTASRGVARCPIFLLDLTDEFYDRIHSNNPIEFLTHYLAGNRFT